MLKAASLPHAALEIDREAAEAVCLLLSAICSQRRAGKGGDAGVHEAKEHK